MDTRLICNICYNILTLTSTGRESYSLNNSKDIIDKTNKYISVCKQCEVFYYINIGEVLFSQTTLTPVSENIKYDTRLLGTLKDCSTCNKKQTMVMFLQNSDDIIPQMMCSACSTIFKLIV